MTIFNGYQFAMEKERDLAVQVAELKKQGKHPKIVAILFREDAGSQLYTRLKKETAERVGIGYEVFDFPLSDPVEQVVAKIKELNADETITGIIIQKPWRRTFELTTHNQQLTTYHLPLITYQDWWLTLTSSLDETKDVDGLHPNTIKAIKNGTWQQEHRVLPATCKAVLSILQLSLQNLESNTQNSESKNSQSTIHNSQPVSIIGKSDLLGTPLFYELKNQGWQHVELLGKKELQAKIDSGVGLKQSNIIVSATGQHNLITDQLITDHCIIIDAGEPKGDVDFESVRDKVSFITPVPGGVGPVTIVSLLENCLQLIQTSL